MNLQERRRFNFVVMVLYAVFFVLYGSLGVMMHVSGDGPFLRLPPPAGLLLSVLLSGLMGGWLVAGTVGGIWLGSRYVGRQSRRFIVLACVFAPFTFFAFYFVGMAVTIPFVIYNFMLLKRNPLAPELTQESANDSTNDEVCAFVPTVDVADLHFKIEAVITEDMFQELKWRIVPEATNRLYAVIVLACIVGASTSISVGHYLLAATGFIIGAMAAFAYFRLPKAIVKAMLDREEEATGTRELYRTISFAEDNISIFNGNTGGTICLKYEAIVRLVETRRTYTLFSKQNQMIVVCKTALPQGEERGAFVCFLKDKCKNIRWRSFNG